MKNCLTISMLHAVFQSALVKKKRNNDNKEIHFFLPVLSAIGQEKKVQYF